MPPKQQPLAQVLPAQQGSAGWPQRAHSPLAVLLVALQMVPGPQRSAPSVPSQQGSPGPPQAEQTVFRQRKPE